MPCPRDEEGFAIITVKDLREYLSQFPDDCRIDLDKDGWMEDETGKEDPTAVEIIEMRGLFWEDKEDNFLVINN